MLAAKKTVRAEMSKILKNMSPESRSLQSKDIFHQIKEHSFYKQSTRVAVYLSMREEVDTGLIVRDILTSGKQCFIPWYDRTTMKMLKLKSLKDLDDLPFTKWNIQQHHNPDNEEDALKTGGLDLVIIPGLAFTLSGHRLGRGKGYYDKFLAKVLKLSLHSKKEVKFIALAFKEQIVNFIPTDPHDIVINEVIHAAA